MKECHPTPLLLPRLLFCKFPLCVKCFVYIQYDIHLTLVSMSLHRPSGNVVNRVNNNKYHPSIDAPQELDKGWYTLNDVPQLNGTGSNSLSYKPHPQKSTMLPEPPSPIRVVLMTSIFLWMRHRPKNQPRRRPGLL